MDQEHIKQLLSKIENLKFVSITTYKFYKERVNTLQEGDGSMLKELDHELDELLSRGEKLNLVL